MKNFVGVIVACAALLSGCGPAGESPDRAGDAPALQSVGVVLVKNKVAFPEGVEVHFNGRLVGYQLIRRPKGEFDRYIVDSTDSMMGVEGAVFAALAKNGYTRRISKESPRIFAVNYVKKGAVTISASFKEHSTKVVGDKVRSRAVFSWKVAG